MLLKVSTTRNRTFLLVQSSDHLTGLTGATPTVTLSKDGAAFAAAGGTVTEIASGWYKIALTTTDTNTKGDLAFHVTATSGDPSDFSDQVVTDLPGDSVASVTGAVGSVTGGVTVTTNNDKTGYSLTQTFPTNFSSLSIDASGRVDIAKWLGTAVTAATAGIPDVNVKNINNVAAATPGAAGGIFIAGTNAPVTITGSGDALTITSTAANGRGLVVSGNGTGSGATVTGGATGPGLKLVGGGTSGDGLDITTTSGDGVSILPTAGSAIVATGNGTSKFGIIATGGTGGTSDGVKAVAGTGGVPIRGDITGNIHGTLDTLTTYTGNTPQTGDAFARLGAPAGASTAADIAAVKTDTGNISAQVVSTRAEPSSVPAATSTLGTKVDWLFALARNKRTTTATVDTLRNDADGATIGTSTISDDGTTFIRSKYV